MRLVQNYFPVATGKVIHFYTTYGVTLSSDRDREGRRPAEMVLLKGNGNQVLWIQVTEIVRNNTFEKDYVPVLKKRTNDANMFSSVRFQ